jgi:hypothetical protein
MSVLGKLMFWKKKDEFSDLGSEKDLAFGDNFGNGNQNLGLQSSFDQGMPQSPMPQQQPSFTPPSFQSPPQMPRYESPPQDMNSKNLEIISSKLDALRASMESINQRLANIEALARGEEDQRRRRYY